MKRIISVIICMLAVLATTIPSCRFGQGDNITGSKILFSKTADDSVTADTEWVYDLEKLSKQITQTTALVYGEPKKTDYKILSQLGVDLDNYEVVGLTHPKKRYGKYEVTRGDDTTPAGILRGAYAEIDEYGCFDFNQEEPPEGDALSDEEATQVALQFLKDHNLWNENMDPEPKIRRTKSYRGDGSGIITQGEDVYLRYFRKANEFGQIYGNSRIDVEIGKTGSVRRIVYSYREYTQSQEVELIPVAEAFKNAKKTGNIKWELENPSRKLNFETVQIRYYVNDIDPAQLFMQPIYIFAGTSYDSQGNEEHFGMFVQANRTP